VNVWTEELKRGDRVRTPELASGGFSRMLQSRVRVSNFNIIQHVCMYKDRLESILESIISSFCLMTFGRSGRLGAWMSSI
jgi:hypothetical protein